MVTQILIWTLVVLALCLLVWALDLLFSRLKFDSTVKMIVYAIIGIGILLYFLNGAPRSLTW